MSSNIIDFKSKAHIQINLPNKLIKNYQNNLINFPQFVQNLEFSDELDLTEDEYLEVTGGMLIW